MGWSNSEDEQRSQGMQEISFLIPRCHNNILSYVSLTVMSHSLLMRCPITRWVNMQPRLVMDVNNSAILQRVQLRNRSSLTAAKKQGLSLRPLWSGSFGKVPGDWQCGQFKYAVSPGPSLFARTPQSGCVVSACEPSAQACVSTKILFDIEP